MKKDNMPEHCQIPKGSHIDAADASEIEKIREELGITPPDASRPKAEAVPEHCQIPKGSHIDAANAARIKEIQEELGISAPEKTSSERQPQACKIPKGSTISGADASQVSKIQEELGITPKVSQPKSLADTIDAETVLRELGDDTDNPMFITIDDKIAQSDLLGKDEAQAIAESLHPDHPKAIEITVMKDGPYIVSGPVPLREAMIRANEKGESIGWYFSQSEDVGDHYALCRCGHSAHMPFCDGAHERCHWDGTCTASTKPYAEAAKIYQAADGCYLMDQENLCAIVRYCDADGSCWNLVQKAKTLPEGIRESLSCASGRLTVVKDGKLVEPKFDPEIDLIDDRPRGKMGPLWVKGGIPVKTQDGTQYEVRNRVTLCRCGNSRNKPFCDGCHLVSDDPDNAPMPTAPADPDALKTVSSASQSEEKKEK